MTFNDNIEEEKGESAGDSSLVGKTYILPPLEIGNQSKEYNNMLPEDADLENGQVEQIKKENEIQPKGRPAKFRFLGLTLGLASSLAFSLAMLGVKVLKGYHPATIGIWRFTGILTPSLPLLLFYRFGLNKPILDSIWPLNEGPKLKMVAGLVGRGILGCAAIVLQYYSVGFMALADSTVIAFSTPVFVTFLARIFLGEKCGIVPIFTAAACIIGVVIISKPPLLTGAVEFDKDNLIGVILAFTSMLCATVVFVILRYIRKIHFTVVTTSFGIIGILECGILSLIVSRFDLPQTPWDWFLGLSIATLTFIGQSFITLAFKFEQAGPVALIRTFDVVFAFIWQFLFLDVVPDGFSLLGSLIVVGGVVLIGVRKWISTLQEDNPKRQRFWFLLK